jgi:hypothetical protein
MGSHEYQKDAVPVLETIKSTSAERSATEIKSPRSAPTENCLTPPCNPHTSILGCCADLGIWVGAEREWWRSLLERKPILLLLREYITIHNPLTICPISSTKINNFVPELQSSIPIQIQHEDKQKPINALTPQTPLPPNTSTLQRKIITRRNPSRSICLPYRPPLTRNITTHLQHLPLCKTNLIRILHVRLVRVNRFCTMRIRRRLFDDTVDSCGRFSGIRIALSCAERRGCRQKGCIVEVGEGGGGGSCAGEGGECAVVDGVGGGCGLHLWGGGDVTGSRYGVGIDPGVRGCGGGGAKVEYPYDLEKLESVMWGRGTLTMERKRCPDAAASSEALGE